MHIYTQEKNNFEVYTRMHQVGGMMLCLLSSAGIAVLLLVELKRPKQQRCTTRDANTAVLGNILVEDKYQFVQRTLETQRTIH